MKPPSGYSTPTGSVNVVLSSSLPDDDGVERLDRGAVDAKRVDLDRDQPGAEPLGEAGKANDRLDEPVDVRRSGPAHPGEERAAAQVVEHLADVLLADRQEPQARVLEHVNPHAAEPDCQRRAPLRVAYEPDDHLDAAAPHRGYERSLDTCALDAGTHGQDALERPAHLVVVADS